MIYKITKIDRKTTSTGKLKANVNLKEADSEVTVEGVGIWSDYPNFATLDVGHTTEGDVVTKGEWKTLYPAKTNPLGFKKSGGAGIANAMETKNENIKEAQERRSDGVKISATFRDATLITVASFSKKPFPTEAEIKEEWTKWRDWLWKQYDNAQPPF